MRLATVFRSCHNIRKQATKQTESAAVEGEGWMAEALWVRTIVNHRTDRQATVPCGRDNPRDALLTACHELDLPEPLWLEKNEREWAEFGQTRFLPDAFFERVSFQRMEIEYIDPDAPKRKSNDPRNAF